VQAAGLLALVVPARSDADGEEAANDVSLAHGQANRSRERASLGDLPRAAGASSSRLESKNSPNTITLNVAAQSGPPQPGVPIQPSKSSGV